MDVDEVSVDEVRNIVEWKKLDVKDHIWSDLHLYERPGE